jgi:hypothetical protein
MVFYAWLVDRQARSEDPMLGQVFYPPADASIIFDCFTHDAQKATSQIIYQMPNVIHKQLLGLWSQIRDLDLKTLKPARGGCENAPNPQSIPSSV